MMPWGVLRAIAAGFGLAVLLTAPALADRISPMSFRIVTGVDGNRWVAAQGDIMENSHRQYDAVVRRGGRGLPVMINSPGGSLLGGMTLGMALRQAGATVVVAQTVTRGGRAATAPGICASACVHALAGGSQRVLAEGSRVGVHESYRAAVRNGRVVQRIAASRDDPAIRQEVLQIQAAYFRVMGVDPDVVRYGIGVPPTQVRRLTDSELRSTGLASGSARTSVSTPSRDPDAGRYRPEMN
jgi:hypothetical protein